MQVRRADAAEKQEAADPWKIQNVATEGGQKGGPIAVPNQRGRKEFGDECCMESLHERIAQVVPGIGAEPYRQRKRQRHKCRQQEPGGPCAIQA